MFNDFLMEKKLAAEKPELSNLATESVFALKHILKSYTSIFPDFTDHTILHSMNVLNYCNKLIGAEQVEGLNADECYVMIMASYLHDCGMGVSRDDFKLFSEKVGLGDYLDTHRPEDVQRTIREYHNEFSGCFTEKYRDLMEIPSDEHLYAIVQVVRGHRKTDLFDETEYPDLLLPDGTVIRIPYLAAVLRLADEIDVAIDRVPEILYDISQLTQTRDIIAFGTHHTIRFVEITDDEIILHVNEEMEEFMEHVLLLRDKISDTLRYCASVCEQRTPFAIRQSRVMISKY